MPSSASTSRPCERERDALRVALELTALALVSDTFCEGFSPLPDDCYVRVDWVRKRLAPLALRIPAIGRVVHELDVGKARGWLADGRQVRRRLDALSREIAAMAKAVRP